MGSLAQAVERPLFVPRSYQCGLAGAIARLDYPSYCAVWHRQSGKDRTVMNAVADICFERVIQVFHCMPKYETIRRGFWEKIDAEIGRRVIDDLTPYGVVPRETDMTLRFPNGSLYQMIGSDNYNTIVSASPFIIVYSEWSLCDPAARSYFLPMLQPNNGREIFIFTPRGDNHGKATADIARAHHGRDWFFSLLTVDDTRRDAPGEARRGEPVVSKAQIARLREEFAESLGEFGMSDEMIDQEFYCSFAGVQEGSILGRWLEDAEREGRIRELPVLRHVPVYTYWDLGRNNSTSLWLVQPDGPWFNVIDFIIGSGVGLEWYAEALQERGYLYGEHVWPHDGAQVHFGAGETREQSGRRLLKPKLTIEKIGSKSDGINAMRAILPRCRFDAQRCARGLKALRAYRYDWDDRMKRFRDEPKHDGASDVADGFRTFAMNARGAHAPRKPAGVGIDLRAFNPNSWQGR